MNLDQIKIDETTILDETQRKMLRDYAKDCEQNGMAYYAGLPNPEDPQATMKIRGPENGDEYLQLLDFSLWSLQQLLMTQIEMQQEFLNFVDAPQTLQ